MGAAIMRSTDRVGTFQIEHAVGELSIVDVYSNLIEDEDGTPLFRLAALVDVGAHDALQRQELEERISEKDTLLLEIQHRVKNNLQMITALIRIEARNAQDRIDTAPFDRLAGRINSIQLIYKLLSEFQGGDEIDLGVYLSEIASSVMHSHAVEGIRLNLKIDAYPVSVNVAMPAGLVVNELLTNALKHAFVGRDGGTITLHSLADSKGCRVLIADDGVGLPEGVEWPKRGKLGELIVRSLRQNAKADLAVESSPGSGTRVTITFTRAASAPDSEQGGE
jgi:two-component sensor histidine kinase